MQVRYFVHGGTVDRLEDAQLVAVALEQPGRALLAQLQPQAVVLAGHRRAVAGQAQRIALGAGQALQAAVRVEQHQAAFADALADLPFAAQVGVVQRPLEAAADRRPGLGRVGRAGKVLLRALGASLLHQLLALQGQHFVVLARVVDAPLALRTGPEAALRCLEAVAVGGQPLAAIQLPFEVGAVGQQCLAQRATLAGGLDDRLVDPGAVRVGGTRAAAQQGGRQEREQVAHGAYSMTRMPSISTCAPRGRAATPMAARAG